MQGQADDAVAELRRSRDLARADPGTVQAIERGIAKVEFQSRVTARMDDLTTKSTKYTKKIGFII
jgi:hypothetical protein